MLRFNRAKLFYKMILDPKVFIHKNLLHIVHLTDIWHICWDIFETQPFLQGHAFVLIKLFQQVFKLSHILHQQGKLVVNYGQQFNELSIDNLALWPQQDFVVELLIWRERHTELV